MKTQSAVKYIESFSWSKNHRGLERAKELLDKIGNPQRELTFVHVAGTNGKGSTCAMLASILQKAGYTTGLYTSPYICRFHERMQVNGREIPDDVLESITAEIRPAVESMNDRPSQFEVTTAIAMRFFLQQHCDIVVLEVGLGGEFDATNVIEAPECAVICNIGLEHTEYLGSTLAEIAAAKAGIIKHGCPAVFYPGVDETEAVFRRVAEENKAPLIRADLESLVSEEDSLKGQVFSWREYAELQLPLLGEHQRKNAAVVLETIQILNHRGWMITEAAVREGLAEVRWPARLEVLRLSPPVLLDGAHNPQCAEALAKALDRYLPGKENVFLLGVLADKDYEAILRILRPCAKQFFCVTPDSPRALPAEDLAAFLRSVGENAVPFAATEEAVHAVLAVSEPVVACGSLYLAGRVRTEVLAALNEKKEQE